jgi:uncharacterized protein YciW
MRTGSAINVHPSRTSFYATEAMMSTAVQHDQRQRARYNRTAFTFYLDPKLVDRARTEVSEPDVIRSIEAALAAAIDYQLWVREVARGERDLLE